jgi:hypothetical protein
MAYEIFRVEVTRDETRPDGAALVEVTAYLDRVPETDMPTRGMLTRAARGVWNSRLQLTGDFTALPEALAAIEAAVPEAAHIRCYEYTVDDEYPRAVAPLVRAAGGKWHPDTQS